MFECIILGLYCAILCLSIVISSRFKPDIHCYSLSNQLCDFQGKTVIITGGNSGLGYNIAEQLAARGARIILACRDLDKANAAKRRIIEATNNDHVTCYRLNLTSLNSVREFSELILSNERNIDVLVNNAGAIYLGDHITDDGLQITWQVNYFAPFLLTNLLFERIQSSNGKIVNVTGSFSTGGVNLQDVNQHQWDIVTYYNAKRATYAMSFELARRLQSTGGSVCVFKSNCSRSNFYRRVHLGLIAVVYLGLNIFGSKPEHEAMKLIRLIQADAHLSQFGHIDEYIGGELWKTSCDYVKLSY